MKICAIIPIKLNNERLPGKNTRLLFGKPLYEYLFNTLKKVDLIDEIYIDCSDDKMLKIAKLWGFLTLKRPVKLNSRTTTGDELLSRIVKKITHDIICSLHVTSPFITASSIEKGIEILKNDVSLDSVFGVIPQYNRFWFRNKEINHNINKLVRTQDLEPIYEEADIYFIKRESFLKYKKRICGKFKYFEIVKYEAIDLDDIIDFNFAESLLTSGVIKM